MFTECKSSSGWVGLHVTAPHPYPLPSKLSRRKRLVRPTERVIGVQMRKLQSFEAQPPDPRNRLVQRKRPGAPPCVECRFGVSPVISVAASDAAATRRCGC